MSDLDEFRHQIDDLDRQLVDLVGRRYEICRQVAELKRTQGIPMMQSGRVEQVKARVAELGARRGVNPDLLRQLYALIIGEACRLEDEIIDA